MKSVRLHSNVPSVIALLPVLWITLALSPNLNPQRAVWILAIVYGLLQIAAYGYEHYFKNNHASKRFLLTGVSVHFLATILSAWFVRWEFSLLTCLYGSLTYVYSFLSQHKITESKLLKAFTNGFLLFVMLYQGINLFDWATVFVVRNVYAGLLLTLVLWTHSPKRTVAGAAHSIIIKKYLTTVLYSTQALLSLVFLHIYVSDIYTPLLLGVILTGALLIYLQYWSTYEEKVHYTFIWITAIHVNGFAFYLFADHTQVFQLVDQL